MEGGLDLVQELGLAEGRRWLTIEKTTGIEFMAALTLALCHPRSGLADRGNRTSDLWTPATDKSSAAKALLQNLRATPIRSQDDRNLMLRVNGNVKASAIRASVLERCVPVAAGRVDVERLLSFRRKHGDRLPSFRRALERIVDRATLIDDEALRLRELDRVVEEIEEMAAQVHAYVREAGFRRIRQSSLVKILKFAPLLAVPVRASEELAASLETSGGLESEPLAYLAFARTTFAPVQTYFGQWGQPTIAELYGR